MSTYLLMWDYVKSLTIVEALAFLATNSPAIGKEIILPDGISVLDVDVIEAVKYCVEHDRF